MIDPSTAQGCHAQDTSQDVEGRRVPQCLLSGLEHKAMITNSGNMCWARCSDKPEALALERLMQEDPADMELKASLGPTGVQGKPELYRQTLSAVGGERGEKDWALATWATQYWANQQTVIHTDFPTAYDINGNFHRHRKPACKPKEEQFACCLKEKICPQNLGCPYFK